MDLFPIQTYPKSVRLALYTLLAAWASFLWSVYQYYPAGFLSRFAIAGALVIFFTLRLKNWARMLCLFSNAMVILYCSFFGLVFATKAPPDMAAAFFSALSALLFLISAYFLLVKPTREFYKQADPPGSGPFPGDSAADKKKP
jgi:hypothetical protein